MEIKSITNSIQRIELQNNQAINSKILPVSTQDSIDQSKTEDSFLKNCASFLYNFFAQIFKTISNTFRTLCCLKYTKETDPIDEENTSGSSLEVVDKGALQHQITELTPSEAKDFILNQTNLNPIFELFIDNFEDSNWTDLFGDVWPELITKHSDLTKQKNHALKYALTLASRESEDGERLQSMLKFTFSFVYEQMDLSLSEPNNHERNLYLQGNYPIEHWILHRIINQKAVFTNAWTDFYLSIIFYLQIDRAFEEETPLQLVLKNIEVCRRTFPYFNVKSNFKSVAIKLILRDAFNNPQELTLSLANLAAKDCIGVDFFREVLEKLDFSGSDSVGNTPLAIVLKNAQNYAYVDELLELAKLFIEMGHASTEGLMINDQPLLTFAKNAPMATAEWAHFANYLEGKT